MSGTVLEGRWALNEMLGMGATGTVYKATDLSNNSIVAVKRINLERMKRKQLNDIMGELDMLQKFQHPNIVKILGFIKSRKELCFVLEYMSNGSLARTLKQHGAFPEEIVANHITQVLKGLSYLHEHNIIHRDIKGDNMLMSGDGRVCLADFGLATKIDPNSDADAEMDVVGTPFWLAPEVILMTEQTTASDIWSMGCTIIELLTGSPPYALFSPMAALFRMVQDDHPPYPKGISEDLIEFLQLCFEKDVTKRACAKDLLNHAWLTKHTTLDSKMDIEQLRKSLTLYNRRPTISLAEDDRKPFDIEDGQSDSDLEEMEVGGSKGNSRSPSPYGTLASPLVDQYATSNPNSRSNSLSSSQPPSIEETSILTTSRTSPTPMAQTLSSLSLSPAASSHYKVIQVIEKLEVKQRLVLQRIQNRQMQENLLSKLSKLYGKYLKEDKENYEKKYKTLKEALAKDLQTKEMLQVQIKRLKSSVYELARGLEDFKTTNPGFLSFKKDEPLYIICRDESSKWEAENILTGERGFVHSNKVEIMKQDKDVTVRERANTPKSPKSPPRHHKESKEDETIDDSNMEEKAEEILNSIQDRAKKDKLSGFFGASPVSIDKHMRKQSNRVARRSSHLITEFLDADKQQLALLLMDHNDIDGKKWVRDGPFMVQIGNDKPKERYVFLFTYGVIITKRIQIKKVHTDGFKIKYEIPIAESRLVLNADKLYKLFVLYKGVENILTPIGNGNNTNQEEIYQSWFKSIKDCARKLTIKKIGSGGKLSGGHYP